MLQTAIILAFAKIGLAITKKIAILAPVDSIKLFAAAHSPPF